MQNPPELKQATLSPEYERIALAIADHASRLGDGVSVFFSIPASQILDVNKQLPSFKSDSYYVCVPFLIGKRKKQFMAEFAVLVAEEADTAILERLLAENRIRYTVVGLQDSRNAVDEKLSLLSAGTEVSEGNIKPFGSISQLQFSSRLGKAFNELVADRFLAIFEEISLRAVIKLIPWKDCANWWRGRRSGEMDDEEWKLHDYGNKTSFDFLVTSASDGFAPQLVIEYDGKPHAEDKKKIQNDRLKDQICKAASLPLIRVHVNFVENTRHTSQDKFGLDIVSFLLIEHWLIAPALHQLLKARNSTPKQLRGDDDSVLRAIFHERWPDWRSGNGAFLETQDLEAEFLEVNGRRLEIKLEQDLDRGVRGRASMLTKSGRLVQVPSTPWVKLKMVGHALMEPENLLKEFLKGHLLKQSIAMVKAMESK